MGSYVAIIFDVGGVLISPPQEAIRAYEKAIKVSGGSVSGAFIRGEPDNAFCKLERGELTLSQFIPAFEKECYEESQRTNTNFPEGFSASELFSLIASLSRPNLRMLTVAKLLRNIGYKTCILTNNWQNDKLELPSILRREFDVVIESCEVGLRKPNPLIYQLACEKLKVLPSQVHNTTIGYKVRGFIRAIAFIKVIFLDDLGRNLKSAHKLGMATIKVKNTDDAIKELEHTLQISLTTHSKL